MSLHRDRIDKSARTNKDKESQSELATPTVVSQDDPEPCCVQGGKCECGVYYASVLKGNSVGYEEMSVPFCENIQLCGILHEKHFTMENFLYKSSVSGYLNSILATSSKTIKQRELP